MINFDEVLKKQAVSKTEAARKLEIAQSNVYGVLRKFNRNLEEVDNFLRMLGTSLSSEISPVKDDQTNSQQQRSSGLEDEAENYYSPYIEALQTIQKQADTIISQQRTIEALLGTSKKAKSA